MTDTPEKEPIRSRTKPSNSKNKNRDPEPILRAELQIPHSIINACEANNRKKNRFEWWKLGIQAATLAIIGVYTFIAYHQWDITRQALTTNERPWIAVDVAIGGDLKFQKIDGSATIPLIITMTNLGKTPAQKVFKAFKVIPSDTTDVAVEEQKLFKYATEAVKAEPGVPYIGYTLFPAKDTPLVVKETFIISPDDVKVISTTFGPAHAKQLMIFGCVAYRYAFDNSIHRTGFIGTIGIKRNPDNPNVVGLISAITEDISSEQIKILQMLQGFYAD